MEVLIDGIAYAPAGGSCSPVGIGITTRNRKQCLEQCLKHCREYTPGAVIVVVDDASDDPVEGADFRFEDNVGIATAKNKCIELLVDAGCQHLFLFDDDCWPIKEGWTEPYVASPEPHLMYVFVEFAGKPGLLNDTKVLYADDTHTAYSHPRGCMLYVDARVLEVVGGMDSSFDRWGYEHGDWSNRIHAAGLTTFRYADVTGSADLIYSSDEHWYDGEKHTSTVPGGERAKTAATNQAVHDDRFDRAVYCPYRPPRNMVLTAYLTALVDPQRGKKWQAKQSDIETLRTSVPADWLVVFSDEVEFHKVAHLERVSPCLNPYFARWLHFYRWLRAHEDVDLVWCVDSTDVMMLNDPFPKMERGKLYVGSEVRTLGIPWMVDNHPALAEWIADNAHLQLLNCGLVGGERETVMRLCHDLIREHMNALIADKELPLDMGPFNHAVYTGGYDFVTGPMVHTLFRANETEGAAWWKHK